MREGGGLSGSSPFPENEIAKVEYEKLMILFCTKMDVGFISCNYLDFAHAIMRINSRRLL